MTRQTTHADPGGTISARKLGAPTKARAASPIRRVPKVSQHMLITILIILAILCAIVFLVRR